MQRGGVEKEGRSGGVEWRREERVEGEVKRGRGKAGVSNHRNTSAGISKFARYSQTSLWPAYLTR